MENKKLFKYLLNDLTEIESLMNERTENCFDEMEMEFFRNRVKGARKLIQMCIDKELVETVSVNSTSENRSFQETTSIISEIKTVAPDIEVTAPKTVDKVDEVEKVEAISKPVPLTPVEPDPVKSEPVEEVRQIKKEVQKTAVTEPDAELNMPLDVEMQERGFGKLASALGNTVEAIAADEDRFETPKPAVEKLKQTIDKQDLTLDDEIPTEQNKRLGDSFTKEKSVNDLRSDDVSKLEHKLSNMPLTNLQTAIGINDRFQYVRELFDGKPETYAQTIADLDEMDNLKDAVAYLQNNFKWKKTDTSLKFVSLIKRRFPNE